MKKFIFTLISSLMIFPFCDGTIYPTDHKFFDEVFSNTPGITKCYLWQNEEGQYFIYWPGNLMQIDSWHIPDT